MSNLRFCNFFLLGFALAVGNMCLLYLADTGVFWNGYIPSGIVLAIGGTILATVYAALTRFGRGMVKLSLDHLGQLQEFLYLGVDFSFFVL